MKDFLPGAKVIIPYKGGESLTKTERKYNKTVSKRRILIEHVIRMLKAYRRLSQVYDGSREEFREDLLVVSGCMSSRLPESDAQITLTVAISYA